ncbi:unnamed protein product, partial [Ilex paraguariensis]
TSTNQRPMPTTIRQHPDHLAIAHWPPASLSSSSFFAPLPRVKLALPPPCPRVSFPPCPRALPPPCPRALLTPHTRAPTSLAWGFAKASPMASPGALPWRRPWLRLVWPHLDLGLLLSYLHRRRQPCSHFCRHLDHPQ